MRGTWREKGFEDFRDGTFGNGGQNLYVSRRGVLQRIHQFDLDGDGYLDLVFCNSQDHCERPNVFVYQNPLGEMKRTELPSDGSWSAAVADLNGDGEDDLVLAMWYNGVRRDVNSYIYYGAPEGFGEHRMHLLPVPYSTCVTAGDFNGDGRPDLAFLTEGKLRLFYQSALGFEPKRFVDLPIRGEYLAAGDLDGDGYADLVVRAANGDMHVFWGGEKGIDPGNSSLVPVALLASKSCDLMGTEIVYEESVEDTAPLARVIRLGGKPHVFLADAEKVFLVPVGADRSFGAPLELPCAHAIAVAVGDVHGDGDEDLVFACRDKDEQGECSWIYWGGEGGFSPKARTRLASVSACDVAVGDLDGDGCADIVLCQSHLDGSFNTDSLIYRGGRQGVAAEPVRLPCQGARRVLLSRAWKNGQLQVILVNKFSGNRRGNIPAFIYHGGPDGFSPERRTEIPAWGAIGAITADLNDDGRVDLLLANASENSPGMDPGSYVYLNGPQGFPAEATQRIPTTRAHGVACGDIDRDGYLDLIFVGFRNSELLIFRGGPNGFDVAHPQRIRMEHEGVVYSEPRWIFLADFNNDGWLDLVIPMTANDRSFILWGGPEGFSMEHSQTLSVYAAVNVRAADLTGNGYLDLMVGAYGPTRGQPHDAFVHVYWNGPDGLREDRKSLLPCFSADHMAVADFNNDGMPDLFVGSYTNNKHRDIDSYIYWNRKGRGFSAMDFTRLFTHSASGCVAADFNEDGWVDLAIANHKVYGDHAGYSAVWWNGPRGFSEERTTHLPTFGPHAMTLTDPGNIMDRGPEEYYVSNGHELPAEARVTRIAWQAAVPVKTWVRAQLRSAASRAALDQAAWMGPLGAGTWFENGQSAESFHTVGSWVQYRLALGAVNGGCTPRVTEVTVEYAD